jgi:hypothetical protein
MGVDMSDAPYQHLLEALLDSWDRITVILLNLLRALPEGGLEAEAIESSPSVAELFTKKFLRNWRQGAPDRAVLTVRVR